MPKLSSRTFVVQQPDIGSWPPAYEYMKNMWFKSQLGLLPVTAFLAFLGHSLSVAYRGGGGLGCSNPTRNSEGPPKSCQTQPDCENC